LSSNGTFDYLALIFHFLFKCSLHLVKDYNLQQQLREQQYEMQRQNEEPGREPLQTARQTDDPKLEAAGREGMRNGCKKCQYRL
jgi:hypothetical protein